MISLFDSCPLGCRAELEQTDIVLPEGALRRCPGCGQLISSCSREVFETTMEEWDTEEGTMPVGRDASRHQQRISKLLVQAIRFLGKPPEKASILDVGCSSGSTLLVARARGFGNIQGVDPASSAAETAVSHGFAVHAGLLHEAQYPDNSFDIITLFEVIEHLTEPLEMAHEIHRLLKPGGLWLFSTGNADSWTAHILKQHWTFFSMQCHGGHISFFSPESVYKLASLTGFTLRKIQTRRVILTEKELVGPIKYRTLKLLSEVLALPARISGKGHQMYAYLQKSA